MTKNESVAVEFNGSNFGFVYYYKTHEEAMIAIESASANGILCKIVPATAKEYREQFGRD